jgi:hypothetical protein
VQVFFLLVEAIINKGWYTMITNPDFSPPFIPDDSPPDSGAVNDDLSDWIPPSKRPPKNHIYRQYFTSKECEMLKAVPENDVKSEIYLIRVLLARAFAQIPRSNSNHKASAPSLELNFELFSIFSRATVALAGLVTLHNKFHDPGNELGDTILEALSELNPWEVLE